MVRVADPALPADMRLTGEMSQRRREAQGSDSRRPPADWDRDFAADDRALAQCRLGHVA